MIETIKAYIDDNKSVADISCPKCHKKTKVSVASLGHKHRSKVKCACSNIFMAEIEFRDKYRKRVDFPGYYEILEREQELEKDGANVRWESVHIDRAVPNCLIIDISRGGIGFITLDDQEVRPRDIVHLSFDLDNDAKTEINQACQVRHVNDNFVGSKMVRENVNLGFYLLG